MVNEPKINVKDLFFTGDFKTLYSNLCDKAFMHRTKLYMACCKCKGILFDQYTLYGTYVRLRVFDAKVIGFNGDIPELETEVFEDFHVQRLKHKNCGHTHGLLCELFIPYQQYTTRFALLHLYRYFHMKKSIEAYCLDNDIPINTFKEWLDWLKENMCFLTELGLTRSFNENFENLRNWLVQITDDLGNWVLKSLRELNQALFQRHIMPAGYSNERIY